MPTIEGRLFIGGPLHGRTLVINTDCYLRVPVRHDLEDAEPDTPVPDQPVPVDYVEYRALYLKSRTLMIADGIDMNEVLEKVVEMLP